MMSRRNLGLVEHKIAACARTSSLSQVAAVWGMVHGDLDYGLQVMGFRLSYKSSGAGLSVERRGFRVEGLWSCFGGPRARVRGLRSGIPLRLINRV